MSNKQKVDQYSDQQPNDQANEQAEEPAQKIRVRAKAQGVYGHLKEPGAQFYIEEAHFSGRWMEHVDDDGKPIKNSPVQKAYDDYEDDLKAYRAQVAEHQRRKDMGDVELPQRRTGKAKAVEPSDLGVYSEDGTLVQELSTGSPLVQKGAVGRPGQDDKSKPNAFDARHEAEQNYSRPKANKGGIKAVPGGKEEGEQPQSDQPSFDRKVI